jgi:hypothetical protein
MAAVVQFAELASDLKRILTPGASDGNRIRPGSLEVDFALKRKLTRVHESAHAVMLTVLRGLACEYITVDARNPRVGSAARKGRALRQRRLRRPGGYLR